MGCTVGSVDMVVFDFSVEFWPREGGLEMGPGEVEVKIGGRIRASPGKSPWVDLPGGEWGRGSQGRGLDRGSPRGRSLGLFARGWKWTVGGQGPPGTPHGPTRGWDLPGDGNHKPGHRDPGPPGARPCFQGSPCSLSGASKCTLWRRLCISMKIEVIAVNIM